MAGGENLLWTSWEELEAGDPDVILVMPCGFDLERARSARCIGLRTGRAGESCERYATTRCSLLTGINISIALGRVWWNRSQFWRRSCTPARPGPAARLARLFAQWNDAVHAGVLFHLARPAGPVDFKRSILRPAPGQNAGVDRSAKDSCRRCVLRPPGCGRRRSSGLARQWRCGWISRLPVSGLPSCRRVSRSVFNSDGASF